MRLMSKVTVSKLILGGVIAGLMTASPSLAAAKEQKSFWKDRQRGWYWGEDVNKTKELDEKREREQTMTPKQKLNQLQEEFDNAKAAAVMDNSEENVKRFLELQQKNTQRASAFANTAKKVILENPELAKTDYPTNNKAAAIAQVKREEEKNIALYNHAKEYGLIVFVAKGCPYCEQLIPVIEEMKNKHGFNVAYVSHQDMQIGDVDVMKNIPLLQQLKVNDFPAAYIFSPKKKKMSRVATGLITTTDLEENIILIVSAIDKSLNNNKKGNQNAD